MSQVTHLRIQPSPLDLKPQILYPRPHRFYWKVPLAGRNANNIPMKALSSFYHWSKSNKERQEATSTVEIGKAVKFTQCGVRSAWYLSDYVTSPARRALGTERNVVLYTGQRGSTLSRRGAAQQAQGECERALEARKLLQDPVLLQSSLVTHSPNLGHEHIFFSPNSV